MFQAFERVYKRSALVFPELLQEGPGRKFIGLVPANFAKSGTKVRRDTPQLHCDQGSVERLNRTIAERIFCNQYAEEFLIETDSRECLLRLLVNFEHLKYEITRLTGRKQCLVKSFSILSTSEHTYGHGWKKNNRFSLVPLPSRRIRKRYKKTCNRCSLYCFCSRN